MKFSSVIGLVSMSAFSFSALNFKASLTETGLLNAVTDPTGICLHAPFTLTGRESPSSEVLHFLLKMFMKFPFVKGSSSLPTRSVSALLFEVSQEETGLLEAVTGWESSEVLLSSIIFLVKNSAFL